MDADAWYRVAYAEFAFATVMLIVVPLVMLLASWNQPPVRKRLLAYWRAAALLGITVYLWIAEMTMGFATSFVARAVVPLVLWRGDIGAVWKRPLPQATTRLARLYRVWWYFAVIYSVAGLLSMIPLLPCAFGSDAAPACQAWYGPPQAYAELLHPHADWHQLGLWAWVALSIYTVYLMATAYRLRMRKNTQ